MVGLSELLETAIDLDVKLFACKMSMDVMEISREDLMDEVSDVVGVAAYIRAISGSLWRGAWIDHAPLFSGERRDCIPI